MGTNSNYVDINIFLRFKNKIHKRIMIVNAQYYVQKKIVKKVDVQVLH